MKNFLLSLLVSAALFVAPAEAQTLRPTQIRGVTSDTNLGTGGLVLGTSPTITTPVINSAAHVGGTWVADAAWTLPAVTLGGAVSSTGNPSLNIGSGSLTAGAISGASFVAGGTSLTAFAGATTLLTLGGTGATSVVAIPGTKASTSSTTGSVTFAGGIGVAGNSFFGGTLGVTSTAVIGSANANPGYTLFLDNATLGSLGLGVAGAATGLLTSDTTSTTVRALGTGALSLYANAAEQMRVLATASANRYLTVAGGVSGSATIPTIGVAGTSATALAISPVTINMTTSGTTLTVGVGADNGTVSAGVFTDRTKAFEGDAVGTLNLVKAKNGHIDHATLPAFARENVRKQTTDAEGKVTETVEVERNIGAMVSILTVAAQELDARLKVLEAK